MSKKPEPCVSFENYCMCGGFAHSMNGRPESQPHAYWCPQYTEYAQWWKAKQDAEVNIPRIA